MIAPSSIYGIITREQHRDPAPCLWCGMVVEWDAPADRADPQQVGDWNIGGDFGCPDSPYNDEEGTGGHITRDDVRALLDDREELGR